MRRAKSVPDTEMCDGVDNDCNGTVDDGCACAAGASRACYGGPAGTAGVGACRAGTQSCGTGRAAPVGHVRGQALPARRAVRGVDNDCDGVIDDGCACRRARRAPATTGPPDAGVGVCADGVQRC